MRPLFHRRGPGYWEAALGQLLLWAAVAMLLAGLAHLVLSHWDDVPVVYKDWTTGECVRVEQAPGSAIQFTCDSLPQLYDVVWVGPR